MTEQTGAARGLILIVFDTLRTDFADFAEAELKNFERLRKLCTVFPKARCGSFPTGPMRTDLLTGRLSFLDARWAVPDPEEVTLPRALREAGVRTTLVTDNYVAALPQLGGMLPPDFDAFDFIRGAGSDPWQTVPAALQATAANLEGRPPSRSVDFEIQYLANLAAWRAAGGTPTERLFASATRQLARVEEHERFLLWIDSFGCHEPWDTSAPQDPPALPDLPLFPGYVERERFAEEHLATWREQYAESIRRVDRAIAPIIDDIERLVTTDDVALAVLSDHGFLFGEHGFVGKPANTPLPPQLHEIVCWLSPHFESLLPPHDAAVQPHGLHQTIRRLFGLGGRDMFDPELHVFGRNSPRSDYVAAANDAALYVGAKTENGSAVFAAIPSSDLDPALPLMQHRKQPLPKAVGTDVSRILSDGRSEWLTPFLKALATEGPGESNSGVTGSQTADDHARELCSGVEPDGV